MGLIAGLEWLAGCKVLLEKVVRVLPLVRAEMQSL